METGAPRIGPGRADVSSRLAFDRTRLAYERTMLSWVRTATSLITFGFSIQQFFRLAASDGHRFEGAQVPHVFGTAMIGIGLFALLIAALEHKQAMATMKQDYPALLGYPRIGRSHARVLASLIGLLGVLALVLTHVRA